MFAFEKTTYEYNLGDRDLSSWFGYSELDLCDFNFLGSKGRSWLWLKTFKDTIVEFKKAHSSNAGSVNTEFSGFSV